jgi:hypothetical protein
MMVITREHGMAQRGGGYARGCLEWERRRHMEEVRGAGGEAIRFDSALNTRQSLEKVYGNLSYF